MVHFPTDANQTTIDHYFQRLAMDEARMALDHEEVPIGALVVVGPAVGIRPTAKPTMTTTTNHKNTTTTTTIMYRILSRQYNRVEETHDASAHAELLALRCAAKQVRNWRLNRIDRYNGISSSTSTSTTVPSTTNKNAIPTTTTTTLYTTLEPCVMCCASAQAFRVNRIVYGAKDLRLGGIESHRQILTDHIRHPYHEISDIVGGIYANESQALLQWFFQSKRRQKKKQSQFVLSKRQPPHPETKRIKKNWPRRQLSSLLRWWWWRNNHTSS